MTFAKRLIELRKSKGISQKELANYIDVSPSLVGMYEQGRRKPSFEILEAIADYFNINIDTLYGKDEIEAPYYCRNKSNLFLQLRKKYRKTIP